MKYKQNTRLNKARDRIDKKSIYIDGPNSINTYKKHIGGVDCLEFAGLE